MRLICSMLMILLFFAVLAYAYQQQQAAQTEFTGCLSQTPGGDLQLGTLPSGKTYLLTGDVSILQQHRNQLVDVWGSLSANGTGNRGVSTVSVNALRVVSASCTSVLPSNNREPVGGKTSPSQTATPVTTAASADETTPGFQTEAVREQASQGERRTPMVPLGQYPSSAFRPSYPEQAGQSESVADMNAAAAIRAEMYPGTTLGVDIKSAPQNPK